MKPFIRSAYLAASVVSLSALTGVAFAQSTPAPAPQTAPPPPQTAPAPPQSAPVPAPQGAVVPAPRRFMPRPTMPPAAPVPIVKLPANVAARVNGQDLTYAQLNAKLLAWAGRPLVQQVVQAQVIEQEAKKQGVAVTPAELNSEIARIKQQQIDQASMQGGMVTWAQIAVREGISEAFVNDQIRVGLLARKAYAKSIQQNIPSLDNQIKVSHILIATTATDPSPTAPKPLSDADAKAKAEKILADIKAGTIKFEDAAKQYSDDKSSAVQGGALPFTPRGRFDPPFDQAAWALAKPGDLTVDVVKSQFGYHIIKLIEKGKDASPAEKAAYNKQQLDQQMQNPQGLGMWVQFLMTNAKVNYNVTPTPFPAPAPKPAK